MEQYYLMIFIRCYYLVSNHQIQVLFKDRKFDLAEVGIESGAAGDNLPGRIKALALRRNSDWCGNWCGRRSVAAAVEEQNCVLFSIAALLLRPFSIAAAAVEEEPAISLLLRLFSPSTAFVMMLRGMMMV